MLKSRFNVHCTVLCSCTCTRHCTAVHLVPDTELALARCQLARGSSWGMICPLCDMWCRFSPWKSDFHNISTSVTHKHRNYPQQTRNSFEKYLTAEGDLWIEGCDIKAQVHWHCSSKVDSGQGLAGRVVAVAPTWSLSLSMVIEVDWQHCQEDTTNTKSAKSSKNPKRNLGCCC